MNYKVAADRFFRAVGGQVLGALVAGSITFFQGDFGVEFGVYSVIIGSALVAFDKFARNSGWYGSSNPDTPAEQVPKDIGA